MGGRRCRKRNGGDDNSTAQHVVLGTRELWLGFGSVLSKTVPPTLRSPSWQRRNAEEDVKLIILLECL